MLLPLKNQGFPGVLDQLGIQSPMQGPFWGFESTVLPIYIIGSENIQQGTTFPYLRNDSADSTNTNPGASATLLQSPNLEAGRYALRIFWAINNSSVTASMLLFKVRDVLGTVIQTVALQPIGEDGSSQDMSRGSEEFLENLNEGDFFFLENLAALASADVRVAWRWARLGQVLRPLI